MTTDYKRDEFIEAERSDNVLTLTLNRPAQYNAIHHELHEELADIFVDAGKNDATDVVVQAMAERLANWPRDAIRSSKVTAKIGLRQLAHSTLDGSMAYGFATLRSPTHQGAIGTFTEGRAARFRGP